MLAATARFGPYQLTECLGRGGMAAVYKGKKRRAVGGFEKQVVVKTILPQLARKPKFVRMFKDEARLSAQLSHNNVVQVLDFGIIDATPFLELEYLSGCNLKQLWDDVTVVRGQVPASIALTIITDVCRGLAYAHSFVDGDGVHRPIIHRDVSPANVMICVDGSVKLLDFGLACLTRGETLSVDTFHGKIAYMSPEQLDKRQVDRRADVFALGVLLHELLSGRRLFVGADDADTLRRMRSMPIDPPSAINPAIPSAVDVVVLRALARDPDMRYPSAADMLAALERLGGLAASRQQLLTWLGSVAPEVYITACDGCGHRMPHGTPCKSCMTTPDGGVHFAEPPVVVEPELARCIPPAARPRRANALRWMRFRWLRARYGATLWWREVQTRIAQRSLDRAEQRLREALG